MRTLILAAILCLPVSLKNFEVRQSLSGISVQIHKISPAYAALEDARNSYELKNEREFQHSGEPLISGQHVDIRNLLNKKNKAKPEAFVKLKGMKVSQIKEILPAQEVAITTAPLPRAQVVAKLHPPTPANLYSQSGNLLPVRDRIDLLAKQYEDFLTDAPSVSDKARQLVQQELAASAANPPPQTIVTLANAPQTITQEISRRIASRAHKEPPALENTIDGFNDYLPYQNVTISGAIQMVDGLAYFGADTKLEIYWEAEGQKRQEAHVYFDQGRYEIVVDYFKGYLVAEYRSSNGQLLGEAEISLYDFQKHGPLGERVNGIDLPIKPVSDGLVVDLQSGRSFDETVYREEESKIYITGLGRRLARNEDDLYSDQDFQRESSFILRAEAKGHWGSLMLATGSDKNISRTYPREMVGALMNLSATTAEDGSIIWGRVLLNGKPVANAEVELSLEGAHPVYFNSYFPDHKLNRTTKNGLFAFAGITPGVQVVRVKFENRYLLAQVVPTKVNNVTHLDIEVGRKRFAHLKVVDGVSQTPVDADLHFIGSDQIFHYKPYANDTVTFPGGRGLMWVEVDAGKEYRLTRMTVSRKARHLNVPVVEESWLKDLAVHHKINLDPNAGTVVGYMDGEDYSLVFEEGLEDIQVVRFDGGFVAFNMPYGYRSVTIVPSSRVDNVLNKVFVAEPDVVNVFHGSM